MVSRSSITNNPIAHIPAQLQVTLQRPNSRNPITQAEIDIKPNQMPRKQIERNPITQSEPLALMKSQSQKIVGRNPIFGENIKETKGRDINTFKDSDIFNKIENVNSSELKNNNNRSTKTFSSTVFKGPLIDPPNRKKLVFDHSSEQLFGDHKDPPVIKPKNKEFNPDFIDMSPEKRRFIDVYGEDKPYIEPKTEPRPKIKLDEDRDCYERKLDNLESNVFFNDQKPLTCKSRIKPKEKLMTQTSWVSSTKVPPKIQAIGLNYAYEKKKEEFQNSSVLPSTNISNIYQEANTTKDFIDNSNVDKRKLMRNYSDLFGLPQNKVINQNQNNLLNNSKNHNNNTASLSSQEHFLHNLKSSLDNNETLQKYQENLEYEGKNNNINNGNDQKKFNVNSSKNAKDLKKLELQSKLLGNQDKINDPENVKNADFYDFDIKGISQDFDFDKEKLQKYCAKKGFHLVDFKANANSLNKINNGTGRLQIRINNENDLTEMTDKISKMGMTLVPHTENHNLKRNFVGMAKLDWKDANLASEERRLDVKIINNMKNLKILKNENFVDAKQSKNRDLQSNGDMFGNSKGVGKWDPEWNKNRKSNGKEITTPEDNVQALNWKKTMKNLEKNNDPIYKNGISFQSQRIFSSNNSRIDKK